jgi:hypothetical protein
MAFLSAASNWERRTQGASTEQIATAPQTAVIIFRVMNAEDSCCTLGSLQALGPVSPIRGITNEGSVSPDLRAGT